MASVDDFPALGSTQPPGTSTTSWKSNPLSFTQALRQDPQPAAKTAPESTSKTSTHSQVAISGGERGDVSGTDTQLLDGSTGSKGSTDVNGGAPAPASGSSRGPDLGGQLETLVVDANAIIRGIRLDAFGANELVTIGDVMNEVRDKEARRLLAQLPYDLKIREPSEEALKAVMKFARATGDLHTLSAPDVKLIALTYTLEAEAHGTGHIRKSPPPLVVVSKHSQRVRNPPGWGTVANPEEWAAIDEVGDDGARPGAKDRSKGGGGKGASSSRILGVTSLDGSGETASEQGPAAAELAGGGEESTGPPQEACSEEREGVAEHQQLRQQEEGVAAEAKAGKEERAPETSRAPPAAELEALSLACAPEAASEAASALNPPGTSAVSTPRSNQASDWSGGARGSRSGGRGRSRWRRRTPKPLIKEETFEGKIVTVGLDASKGEDAAAGPEGEDWERAVCRTTRRRYLIRQQRRAAMTGSGEGEEVAAAEVSPGAEGEQAAAAAKTEDAADAPETGIGEEEAGDLTGFPSRSDAEEASAEEGENGRGSAELGQEEFDEEEDGEGGEAGGEYGDANGGSHGADGAEEGGEVEEEEEEEQSLAGTHGEGGEDESEASWALRPMWESQVACMTADFAMQNVILQMGLRLLSYDGVRIRELQRWALKCSACRAVTREMGRTFCADCGNGGTLAKVSVTVGENGTLQAGMRKRFNIRGTRYSLPMPKGGREGALVNPVLREDQLPKGPWKKKVLKGDESITSPDFQTWFQGLGVKGQGSKVKGPVTPFGSRRNPNERRVGRG
eukprot:jgi/Mesen1/1576/ME000134S00696